MAHDRHAVGEAERLVLVVGDEDRRRPHRALDLLQLGAHLLAQLAVQRGQRFVEQQHARADHERARQGDALLLAAGELRGASVGDALQANEREGLAYPIPGLRPADPALAQTEGDVVGDAHVREQRVGLEDDAEPTLPGGPVGDLRTVDAYVPGVGHDEAGDHVERGRLAAARGPEQRQQLALVDREVDAVHGHRLAVGLADALQRHDRLAGAHRLGPPRAWPSRPNTRESPSQRSAAKTATNVAAMKSVESAAIVGSV